jgi:hypothetical protein
LLSSRRLSEALPGYAQALPQQYAPVLSYRAATSHDCRAIVESNSLKAKPPGLVNEIHGHGVWIPDGGKGKLSPFLGARGNIRALGGSRTNDRSTVVAAPSGTPAAIRKLTLTQFKKQLQQRVIKNDRSRAAFCLGRLEGERGLVYYFHRPLDP